MSGLMVDCVEVWVGECNDESASLLNDEEYVLMQPCMSLVWRDSQISQRCRGSAWFLVQSTLMRRYSIALNFTRNLNGFVTFSFVTGKTHLLNGPMGLFESGYEHYHQPNIAT